MSVIFRVWKWLCYIDNLTELIIPWRLWLIINLSWCMCCSGLVSDKSDDQLFFVDKVVRPAEETPGKCVACMMKFGILCFVSRISVQLSVNVSCEILEKSWRSWWHINQRLEIDKIFNFHSPQWSLDIDTILQWNLQQAGRRQSSLSLPYHLLDGAH